MNSAEELSRVSGQVFQDLKSSAQSQCGVTSAPVPPPKSFGAGPCVGGVIPGADGLSEGVRTVFLRGGSAEDNCATVRVIRLTRAFHAGGESSVGTGRLASADRVDSAHPEARRRPLRSVGDARLAGA